MWRDFLRNTGIDDHPAQLVWVSHAAMGRDGGSASPRVEHREPPVPSAWAVFQRPVPFGSYHHDGGVDQPALLRSVEWSHRCDGTVVVTGYVVRVEVTAAVPATVVAAATREGSPGLLPFKTVAAIGGGTLISGEPVPGPISAPSSGAPRAAQRKLLEVVQRVWARWDSPRSPLAVGQVFLPGDFPGQGDSTGHVHFRRSSGVLIVSRRGEVFPHLGEVVPWERPRVQPDHRWLVRGHYRHQPCGPGGRYRRKIWIPEHISGPPGKPVRHDAKVVALR